VSDAHADILRQFNADRVLAHQVLFPHRHKNVTPPFIKEMILDWHSKEERLLFKVFRGGAKSTTAEEAILLKGAFREIHNYLIIGATKDRAHERLHAIRWEIEQNDRLAETFGDLRGPTWGDGELVLSNNVRLLALGWGQSLRGVKYLDARPDGVFMDDLEEPEDVRTPEARERILDWVLFDLIPALDTNKAHARCAATPLDPEALPIQLERAGWTVRSYPIEYTDDLGVRRSTWPDRETLEKIDFRRNAAIKVGKLRQYNQEYMVQAETAGDKAFKKEMFRIEPQVRTWQNRFCMYDPARTVGAASATTGFADWSWIGGRLIIWEGWGRQLMPDEIIKDMFRYYEECSPTWIGVEEDGLNQWLLQPIRAEQVRRGVVLPVRAVKAPKGKLDFIRGLQPYFHAREAIFAKDLPEMSAQLLSFPTGRIDAPNALAYAPRLRPGAPMYEDFGSRHVSEDMRPLPGRPLWLAMSATGSGVTAVLMQILDGAVRVYQDWMREGEPAAVLGDLMKDVTAEIAQRPRLVMGPKHYDQYNNFGLRQAASRLNFDIRQGTQPEIGRVIIRDLLRKELRGVSAVLVSDAARWALNGFAGGYCRALLKGGLLAEYAEEGPYRTMLEGIESFAGLMKLGMAEDDPDQELQYDYTATGRRFLSARVRG
jgi:hypothetical protein